MTYLILIGLNHETMAPKCTLDNGNYPVYNNHIGLPCILYSLTITSLIYIGYIDWNTQYIPVEFNVSIMILGIIRLILEPDFWLERLSGCLGTALLLYLINWIGALLHKGRDVIGGGDIRLMAAAG